MAKTAIIVTGGGMRSAHGAGFLYALATKLDITAPDVMIGSSGGAGAVIYFSAQQYEGMRRIWLGLLSTPKFVSPLRFWKVMNVDYAVDDVFKKQEPLDTAALLDSPIHWLIAVTDAQTGATRYVGKADGFDPFEILRASKAIPVLYGKRVKLGDRAYVDGEMGPTLEDHIRKTLAEGARNILVVNDARDPSIVRRTLMEIYAAHLSRDMREVIIRDISTRSVCLSAPDASIVCVMSGVLPARLATHDQRKLTETFEKGISDALEHEQEIQTLFATP